MSLPLAGRAGWLQPPPSCWGYRGTGDKHRAESSQVLAASVALVPLQPWLWRGTSEFALLVGAEVRKASPFPGQQPLLSPAEPPASPHHPRAPGGAELPRGREKMGTLLRVLGITPDHHQGEVSQSWEFGDVLLAPTPAGNSIPVQGQGSRDSIARVHPASPVPGTSSVHLESQEGTFRSLSPKLCCFPVARTAAA